MSNAIDPQPDAASKPAKPKADGYPWYAPRFWHGMRWWPWMCLLARNRFKIHPLRITMALIITVGTVGNSFCYWLQRLIFGRRVARTELVEAPIFVLGHWRSGTTHLHELLSLNDKFTSPNTYECFCPNHFLLTGWIGPTIFAPLLPSKRPMDNMSFGWTRPQEDEFGLLVMDCVSPYLHCAFPNEVPTGLDSLDMTMPPAAAKFWGDQLRWFMQAVTVRRPKRLVMKSPPHTGRIGALAELFPGAKFVHIVRDPLVVFASTRKLWRALDTAMGLQHATFEHLDEFILECGERMYRAFSAHKNSVPAGNLVEIRYEDLVARPLDELRRIYEQLQLGDFEAARPKLEAYLESQKNYQRNKHSLEPEVVVEITRRWGEFFRPYGYLTS